MRSQTTSAVISPSTTEHNSTPDDFCFMEHGGRKTPLGQSCDGNINAPRFVCSITAANKNDIAGSFDAKKKSCLSSLVILRSWYKAQKPLKPGNAKKIRKNDVISHPGSGPKNAKKIQKKYENGHFWAIFMFFSCFRGPTQGGGFRNFLIFFSYLRA